MEKQYNKFNALLQELSRKKSSLQNSIDDERKQFSELEDAYRKALASDDDKKADEMQQEMDKLKRSMERKKDKIQFIDDGAYNDTLKQQADHVLQESNENINRFSNETQKLYDEYNELRDKLLHKAAEYNEYSRIGQPYKRRMENIAKMFPDWAGQHSEFHNTNNRGGTNYVYQPSVKYPTIKGITDKEIQSVKKGHLK